MSQPKGNIYQGKNKTCKKINKRRIEKKKASITETKTLHINHLTLSTVFLHDLPNL